MTEQTTVLTIVISLTWSLIGYYLGYQKAKERYDIKRSHPDKMVHICGDTTVCHYCDKVWDTNDIDQPYCH